MRRPGRAGTQAGSGRVAATGARLERRRIPAGLPSGTRALAAAMPGHPDSCLVGVSRRALSAVRRPGPGGR
jgi:hypothetical protein